MISERQIREIIAQYERHGWSLRRVLLSAELKNNLPAPLFGSAEINAAALNALWFSRESFAGREAWELRHISDTPFALLEVFESEDEEEVREQARQDLETQLLKQASKPER